MIGKPIAAAATIAVIFAGCSKHNSPGSASDPSAYELTSMVLTNPMGGTYQAIYCTYNSAHLLTDYFAIDAGLDTTWYHLDYSDGLATSQVVYNRQSPTYFWSYTYNSHGWLVSATSYDFNSQAMLENCAYSYNDSGLLTDRWSSGPATGGLQYHSTYTYNSNGNLAQEIDSFPGRVGTLMLYTGYDNKVNAAKALNGLPILTYGNNPFTFSSSLSPNNVTTFYDDWLQGPPDTYTYQYNEAGLPSQQQENGFTTTYTYGRF